MVIAEIPNSIRQYSPNETRSVEAAYVHPGLGTGAAVEGMLRVEGQLQLRRFYARNIREVTPLTWKPELCGSLLYPLEASDVLPPVQDKNPSHVVPDDSEDPRPAVSGNPEEYTFEDMEREYGLAEPFSSGYSPTLGSDSDQEAGGDEEYVPKRRSARSRPVKRPNAVGGGSEADKSRKVVSEKFFTPGCPACQSGMNAPGIRHTARCKRRREELNKDSPVSGQREDDGGVVVGPRVFQPLSEQPADLGEAQKSEFQGQKRQSDTSLEKLEEDLKGEGEDMEVDHDLFSLLG